VNYPFKERVQPKAKYLFLVLLTLRKEHNTLTDPSQLLNTYS